MDTSLIDIILNIWDRQDSLSIPRWAFFPCGLNKKPIYPKGHKYGDGHNSATTDVNVMRDMFKGITVAGGHIGVAGGKLSGGIFALDIDVKNPLTPDVLKSPEYIESYIMSEHGDLPHTAIQATPSGGRHRIYYDDSVRALNDVFKVKNTKIASDIKGEGGYFVLYDYNMEFDSVVDAPKWIRNFLSERKTEQSENPIDFNEDFSEGNRNDGLTRIAGKFWNYGDSPEILSSLLHGHNLKHCKPPLPGRDVDRIVQSALDNFNRNYEKTNIDIEEKSLDEDDFNCFADFIIPIGPEIFVLERTIVEGGVTMITGESGCGKTWVAVDLCLSILQGEEWLGLKTKQKNIFIIDEESGKNRLIRRMRKLAAGREMLNISSGEIVSPSSEIGRLPIKGRTMRQTDLRHSSFVMRMEQKINKDDIGVILIDAFADVTPGANENDVKDMVHAVNNLKYLCEKTGVTIIIIHHNGKAKESAYRGSTAIKAAVDAMLVIHREKDSDILSIESEKERDIKKTKIGAVLEITEYSARILSSDYIDIASQFVKNDNEEERLILQYLYENGEIAQSNLTKMISISSGLSEKTITRRIQNLAKSQLLELSKARGTGATMVNTVKLNFLKEEKIKNILGITV